MPIYTLVQPPYVKTFFAIFNAGSNVLKFILDLLKNALEQENHVSKKYLFSAEETVSALDKLALNEKNKVSKYFVTRHYIR